MFMLRGCGDGTKVLSLMFLSQLIFGPARPLFHDWSQMLRKYLSAALRVTVVALESHS